jgi:hypothetical protein
VEAVDAAEHVTLIALTRDAAIHAGETTLLGVTRDVRCGNGLALAAHAGAYATAAPAGILRSERAAALEACAGDGRPHRCTGSAPRIGAADCAGASTATAAAHAAARAALAADIIITVFRATRAEQEADPEHENRE